MHTKQLPNNLGCYRGVGQLSLVVFHNPFFPFQSLFKLTKISLKFTFTAALRGFQRKLGDQKNKRFSLSCQFRSPDIAPRRVDLHFGDRK